MELYIITNSWNFSGYGHGARSEVFTTKEAAETRMNEIAENLQHELKQVEDAQAFWRDDKTCELYERDETHNFERYELSVHSIEV